MQWSILAIVLALFSSTSVFAQTINRATSNVAISRADAVYRLVVSNPRLRERVQWYRTHMPPLPLFHDVPQTSSLAPYLEVAFEAGLIAGNRDRLFHPHGPLSQFSSAPSTPTVRTILPVPTLHTTLFALSIPTLGIDHLPVAHPHNPTTQVGILEPLKSGVGHLFSFPGGGGTVLIYGHSSGYPWDLSRYTRIFRQVNRLTMGDRITVLYQGQPFVYQVTGKERVRADDMYPFQEDRGGEELILYTCWPPDSTSERLLVRARPVVTLSGR